MKKKIFLISLMVALFVCLFVVSISAVEPDADYLEKMTSGMKTVTLEDGTVVNLYDEAGKALTYYNDPTTGELTAVRAEDLVYGWNGTKLLSISLANGTVLARDAQAGIAVVVNLRQLKNGSGVGMTGFSGDNLFKEKSPLQHIFMPDTIVDLGTCSFYFRSESNSHLIGCYFSKDSQLKTIGDYAFALCAKLKAFYMPSGVTSIGSSAFSSCRSLYFVEEAGTLEKPSVYFFPENLQTLTGETLKFCSNMNETIVFGTKVTSISNSFALAFNDSVKRNVVFLGEMTAYTASAQVKYTTYYFANLNSNFTPVNNGTKNNFYFCSAENTVHLQNPKAPTVQGASCTESAMTFKTCFCETKFDVAVDETNPALGHICDFDVVTSIVYADYTKNGAFSCGCKREGCAGVENYVVENTALFEYLGMAQDMNSTRITVGYFVNEEYVALFNANGGALTYGVVAYVPQNETDLAPLTVSEGVATPVEKDYTIFAEVDNEENQYSSFDFIVSGFPTGNTTLIMCAFACDGNDVVYLGNTQTNTANTITVTF